MKLVKWVLGALVARVMLMFRWMTIFADRIVGKDFDGGLANLKALAEQS